MKKIEDAIQKQLVLWIRSLFPEIDLRSNKLENKKNVLEAVNDKRKGQAKAGTPDLTLFCDYNDLTYILELELKTKKGKLNQAQIIWHKDFKSTKNHIARIAYGLDEAKTAILKWVDGVKNGSKC
jgi:hypothetical protein